MRILVRFARDSSGATAIEYGLIASLVAVALVGALGALGGKLKGTIGHVASNLS